MLARAMKRLLIFSLVGLSLTACIGSKEPAPAPSSSPTSTSLRDLVTPGVPRWRALTAASVARQEVAAAEVDGLIYVAGGLTASGATNRVDAYDIAKDAWFAAPPLPVALHHAMAVTFAETIWVIGGFDGANKPSTRTFFLNRTKWVEGPFLSEGRAAGGAAVIGNTIYVVAGQGAGGLITHVEAMDKTIKPLAWKKVSGLMQTARHHVGVATNGTHIFVSAGRLPGGDGKTVNTNVFERYTPSTGKWESLPNVPTARSGHGSGFMLGKVVVTGGEDPEKSGFPSIPTTEEYDPVKNVWSRSLPGMFRARHGIGVVVVDGKLYALLGGSRTGLSASADADVLYKP